MRSLLVIPLLVAALGVLGAAPSVRAEEPPPESANVELARAEYDLGAEAFAAGRFREAITHFEETNRLVPNPALAYNIALAYDSIGEVPSALRYYRDYLRALPNAEDRAEVIASIRRLEKRLTEWGVQQLTVTVKPAGAIVSVDGTRVGEAPWTGEITPGEHHLEVTAPGHAPASLDVTLTGNRAMDVTFELQAANGQPAAPGARVPARALPPDAEGSPPPRRGGASAADAVALGAVGLGAGALVGALLLERSRAAAEDDAVAAPTQVAAAAELDTIDQRRTTARVTAGIGAALIATGAVVFAVDRSPSRARRARSAALDVGCGLERCAVTVRGRWR